MKYALIFQKDGKGMVHGYSMVSYNSYLMDLKNKGHKPDRYGYETAEAAREAGNAIVGTDGSELTATEQQQEQAEQQA